MAQFTGTLNKNEIYQSIYNMIISQTVRSDLIGGMYSKLTNIFRVDGSKYGDTKLFYSVQLTYVEDWKNDSEAANLLSLKRPEDPYCTKIVLDTFKMIWLTVDRYMSARAFSSEGVFGQFTSVILGTISDTKRVFFTKLMNVAIGTDVRGATNGTSQKQELALPVAASSASAAETEATNRLRATAIAQKIAKIFVELQDVNSKYNDLGYDRSYNPEDFIVVWNANYQTEILKIDLPTIFHKDGMIAKLDDFVLPAEYFGEISTSDTSTEGQRSVKGYLKATASGGKTTYTWYKPGDVVPTGTKTKVGDFYTENSKVICKIIHKDALQVMSGFESSTEFFNPRSLTENHYAIFAYSDPQNSKLPDVPVITLTEKAS